jgi:hypothetical protein
MSDRPYKKKKIMSEKDWIDLDIENDNKTFDYELIIIGGGSGGLACGIIYTKILAKRANRFLNPEKKKNFKKVAILDFVKKSPYGTTYFFIFIKVGV